MKAKQAGGGVLPKPKVLDNTELDFDFDNNRPTMLAEAAIGVEDIDDDQLNDDADLANALGDVAINKEESKDGILSASEVDELRGT